MNAPLRPMNLGEILDRAFQIYRSRFLLFAGLAIPPALVMTAIQLANQYWWKMTPDPYDRRIFLWFTADNLGYSLVLAQGKVLFSLFLWPAFALATSKFLFEEPCGLVVALSECFKRWKRWIGLTVANWSLQLLVPELIVAGLLIGTVYLMFEVFKMDRDDPLGLGPWMLVASLAAIFAAYLWAGSMIAISTLAWAIENIRIGSAIRKAYKLSKGSRWRIVIAHIVPLCIGWPLTYFISGFLAVLSYYFFRNSAGGWYGHRNLLVGISIVTQGTVSVLVGPICPIALTLIYYDQRIRKEGFDIEHMMRAAGWAELPIAKVAADAAGQAEGQQA